MDNRISSALAYGWDTAIIKPGMPIIVVTGWRMGAGFTNTVRIITVPDHRPEGSNYYQ